MIYLLNPVFQGHSPSVIRSLHIEIARLEEIKKANIEKFVNTLRNELHGIWDDCFYSPDQRNMFRLVFQIIAIILIAPADYKFITIECNRNHRCCATHFLGSMLTP